MVVEAAGVSQQYRTIPWKELAVEEGVSQLLIQFLVAVAEALFLFEKKLLLK